MKKFDLHCEIVALLLLFLLALIVRFLYFPDNVYFAFDQARDFYSGIDILKGDLRLIGPPSGASDKLFPGPLSLYVYSSVMLLFGKNPAVFSIFFRIYNALGVIFVFLIASKVFGKRVGILSSILYAVSYEQSQYSLFMSHQPLAILPVLLLYVGLTMLIFGKKASGLVISALGLGLSIQFHYVYIFLIPIVVAALWFYRKKLPKQNSKNFILATLVFLATILSYIISEIKFGFRGLTTLLSSGSSVFFHGEVFYAISRFIHDNFWANESLSFYISVTILFVFAYLLVK